MKLPKDLEIQFKTDYYRLEEEKHMPYVTSIERLAKEEGLEKGREEGREEGLEKGLRAGIALALKLKFPEQGNALMEDIRPIKDVDRLQEILDALEKVSSVEEWRILVKKQPKSGE